MTDEEKIKVILSILVQFRLDAISSHEALEEIEKVVIE